MGDPKRLGKIILYDLKDCAVASLPYIQAVGDFSVSSPPPQAIVGCLAVCLLQGASGTPLCSDFCDGFGSRVISGDTLVLSMFLIK